MKCQTLDVWTISARLSVNVYTTPEQCKQRGFKEQITRACLSIPGNIAEGMEKESLKEQAIFLEISKGSAAEFATKNYIGNRSRLHRKRAGNDWIQ